MQSSATTTAPRFSQYWRSRQRRALIFLLMTMLTLALAGCATTGNIPTNYDVSASKNSGLVLFSVTHDKDTEYLFRRGTEIRFNVYFRNADNNIEIPSAFSNDTSALIVTSQFESVWGRAYVREFVAGRYELSGWRLEQGIGAKTRTTNPKKPLPPIAFEVQAGSVAYIGNVHGSLQWGRKKMEEQLSNWREPRGTQRLSGSFPQSGTENVSPVVFPVDPFSP